MNASAKRDESAKRDRWAPNDRASRSHSTSPLPPLCTPATQARVGDIFVNDRSDVLMKRIYVKFVGKLHGKTRSEQNSAENDVFSLIFNA